MTDKGNDLRLYVLEILIKQEKTEEKLNLLIKDVLEDHRLKVEDRAFIKKLSEGTVERRITLDHVIDRFSNVKSSKLKPVIRNILRMGIYQILFLDSVPAHAAINEAVKLTRKKHMGTLSGFVNAVLRSVEREGFKPEDIKEADIRYSCPSWIYEKFREDFGEERAVGILENSLKRQPVYIRTNTVRVSPPELLSLLREKGIMLKPAKNRDYAFSIEEYGDMTALPEFKRGLFSVQDISSMSIGDEIRSIVREWKPSSFRILDLCASPGGKSCHAAEILLSYIMEREDRILKIPDFSVESRDISEKKRLLIEENRERLGLGIIRTAVRDAAAEDILPEEREAYDLIIADLPCSGLGVMGRKNDLKYRVRPEDLESLRELQRKMLVNAAKMLKSRGTLIFSVCTVDREETVDQDLWIRDSLGFEKIRDKLVLPGEEESDGFYYGVYLHKL